MEKYRIEWIPSPDDFVERQDVVASIDGAAPAIVSGPDGLLSSANSADILFPTGAGVSLLVRSTGDNGKVADSEPLTFTATNQAPLRPATTVMATWIEHQA